MVSRTISGGSTSSGVRMRGASVSASSRRMEVVPSPMVVSALVIALSGRGVRRVVAGRLLEDGEDGGEVAVFVAELFGAGESVVGGLRGREVDIELGGHRQREPDVLVHQPDVEPGVV